MNKPLLSLVCLFFLTPLYGQNPERILVKGYVYSEVDDVEAVTVFNTSSNVGTITNNQGEFEIAVALNDIIEISALQFKPAKIIIDATVIDLKVLKIQLFEQVNQLDAVVISAGLSGNLATDISNIKKVNVITIDMGDLSAAYEYNDDKASDNAIVMEELQRITNKGGLKNGINFAQLLGINRIWFKKKQNTKTIPEEPKTISDLYSNTFLSETFTIPSDKVETFINFMEAKGVPQEFLKPENEMQLLEFLFKQSKLFLSNNDVKN